MTKSNVHRHPVSGINEEGRPYSCGGQGYHGRPDGEDVKLLDELSPVEREIVLLWILEQLVPRKTVNDRRTSYGIKHDLERDTFIYITNNQFKDAMLQCGYLPHDEHELNWRFSVSSRSPGFHSVGRRGSWLAERDPALTRKLIAEFTKRGWDDSASDLSEALREREDRDAARRFLMGQDPEYLLNVKGVVQYGAL